MNEKQRIICFAAAALIVAALLFPPFQFNFPNGVVRNLGYGFLFSPPPFVSSSGLKYPGSVNIIMLFMEWVGILIVAAIAWLLARK